MLIKKLGIKRPSLSFLLFIGCWIAFAYFHQGGGWNQNARFAMVRAIVEQRSLSIDNYLIYVIHEPGSPQLGRVPIENGLFELKGQSYQLVWGNDQIGISALNGDVISPADTKQIHVESIAASADISFALGHIVPNKAPGSSFAAVPAYSVIYFLTRLLSGNPDTHMQLTINAWLTNMFSNALISALGVVFFFKLILLLWPVSRRNALAVSLIFATGTMWFPYATMLYEQNISASCLLIAFYFLVKATQSGVYQSTPLAMAGMLSGGAVLASYIAVFPVIFFAVYLLFKSRQPRPLTFFVLGGLLPMSILLIYNQACFGHILTTNYAYQNPTFKTEGTILGVFDGPQFGRLISLLFSPFRGLFFSSPILLLAVVGLIGLWKSRRAELMVIASVIVFFVLFNISFGGWYGGWSVVPRYLGPMVPFLALGLAPVLNRFPLQTALVAICSCLLFLLITVVDPQSPIGTNREFSLPIKLWKHNHVTDYLWPLFWHNRAIPLINAQTELVLEDFEQKLREKSNERSIDATMRRMRRQVSDRAATRTISYAPSLVIGPISANPMGMYESWYWRIYQNARNDWNSFNAGEFIFGHSRLSLLPLLIALSFIGYLAFRQANEPLQSSKHSKDKSN